MESIKDLFLLIVNEIVDLILLCSPAIDEPTLLFVLDWMPVINALPNIIENLAHNVYL